MSVVYALADPQTLEIRYVGKTVRTPARRLQIHRNVAARQTIPHVCAWIRGLGISPVMLILERDPPDLEQAEIRWIAELREAGFNLCNMTDGGDGRKNYVPTEETKARISASSKGHPSYVHTAEHRRTISEANTRRIFTPEMRQNMSEAHKGKAMGASNPMFGRHLTHPPRIQTVKACGKAHAFCKECRPDVGAVISTAKKVA